MPQVLARRENDREPHPPHGRTSVEDGWRESSRSELLAACAAQRLPGRPLGRGPGHALPRDARRARRRVLHPGRVEGRSPPALVVLSQLEVEALPVHPDGDVTDAAPGVEPDSERVEGAAVERVREPSEPECCPQELAALVEHGYSKAWSARPSTDGGIVSPSAFAVFKLITNSNLVGCSTGSSPGRAPLMVGRARLLDHLGRLEEQGLWNCQPERLGGREIDAELELRGLLDW